MFQGKKCRNVPAAKDVAAEVGCDRHRRGKEKCCKNAHLPGHRALEWSGVLRFRVPSSERENGFFEDFDMHEDIPVLLCTPFIASITQNSQTHT